MSYNIRSSATFSHVNVFTGYANWSNACRKQPPLRAQKKHTVEKVSKNMQQDYHVTLIS